MIELQLNNRNYLLVEVPIISSRQGRKDCAFKYEIVKNNILHMIGKGEGGTLQLPCECKIIGLLKDIFKDEQTCALAFGYNEYEWYNERMAEANAAMCLVSIQLDSQNIYTENYLLIQKL